MKLALLLIPFALYGQQNVSDQQAAINQQLLQSMQRDNISAGIVIAIILIMVGIVEWRSR